MEYLHHEIELKWQQYWKEQQIFKTTQTKTKKSYILDMFPYPSGSGLHVGHLKGYFATDIIARYKKMQGYDVLHPIGWDAFGLPAEQYALKTKNNPVTFTNQNINNFRNQLQRLGFSYDYEKEVNTTDPNYYRWTQWIFLQLYQQNLVELKAVAVNWCEELKTVLANEEVLIIDGKMVSERGHYPVIKKPMQQWVMKITKYADRLLKGLADLDWPHSVKELQRNWIGASEGVILEFKIQNHEESLAVFTTRIDTIFGVTAVVLAPEHPLVRGLTTKAQQEKVRAFLDAVAMMSDLERQKKTANHRAVFTGSYVYHPVTQELLPIWIGDYVLNHYGTGAIMLVPAHNLADYNFAIQYQLPIKRVILQPKTAVQSTIVTSGTHINSQFLDGLDNTQALLQATDYFIAKKIAKHHTSYKLKDWLFSRQRYWGEPIPIIFWEDGTSQLVAADELPVLLPEVTDIKPSGDGKSPLANISEFVNVTNANGLKGCRDVNTMPQWAGSCWYYLAYILKQANGTYTPLSSPEGFNLLKQWLPVDLYIGGQEHAVLHLLYARFWHLVLYDLKLVPTSEPFKKLVNQGMILANDGEKMAKSKNNGVNPDDLIDQYGADALRVYEMFMGPLTLAMKWDLNGVASAKKWLDRVYRLVANCQNWITTRADNGVMTKLYHQTVADVTTNLDNLAFNNAIATLMNYVNACYKYQQLFLPHLLGFVKMLSLFAVHLGEELWAMLNQTNSVFQQDWPQYEPAYLVKTTVKLIVQINGKLKKVLEIKPDQSQAAVLAIIDNDQQLTAVLSTRKIKKIVYVANKIINFVVTDDN